MYLFTNSVGKESDTGTLEAGAAFLFETFKDQGMVSHNTTVKLKGMFGPFPASAATKACDIVHRLIALMSLSSIFILLSSILIAEINENEYVACVSVIVNFAILELWDGYLRKFWKHWFPRDKKKVKRPKNLGKILNLIN